MRVFFSHFNYTHLVKEVYRDIIYKEGNLCLVNYMSKLDLMRYGNKQNRLYVRQSAPHRCQAVASFGHFGRLQRQKMLDRNERKKRVLSHFKVSDEWHSPNAKVINFNDRPENK
jgi:hypothetical protein